MPWLRRPIIRYPKDLLTAVAVFVVSLTGYVSCLPRTVTFEDSAEFVTATATLGILHPSGYPLYVLLAKPFTWLPFGTMPWRVALFSAVCAALAVALLCRLILGLAASAGWRVGWRERLVTMAVSLQLTFSGIWWSQAIYAKNYALHALLMVVTLWCVWRTADQPKQDRWIYATALTLGLAAANHLSLTVPVAPFVIAALLYIRRDLLRPSRRWLWFMTAGLAGLLPYAYLPIRSAADPAFALGAVNNLGDFFYYVTRARYADFGLGGPDKIMLFGELVFRAAASVGGPLVILAATSFVAFRRRPRQPAINAAGIVLSGWAAVLIVIVAARGMAWTPAVVYYARVWGLPLHAAIALLAGLGGIWLFAEWRPLRRIAVANAALAVVMALTVFSWFGNGAYARAFADDYPDRYLRAVLASLPPDAVLVVKDYDQTYDTELFVLAYLQAVEGLRPDVTVVHDAQVNRFAIVPLPSFYGSLPFAQMRLTLLWSSLLNPPWADRPLYATFPAETAGGCPKKPDGTCWRSRSNGLVYEVRGPAGQPSDFSVAAPPRPDSPALRQSYALDLFVSHALYNFAGWQAQNGDTAGAQKTADAARLLAPANVDDGAAFAAHRDAVVR